MIVNTAYIYMGGGGTTVNPVIFSQNEINYKYTGTNFNKTADNYFEMLGNSELIFENLDLTNFENLKVIAKNNNPRKLYLTVNFIDSSGQVSDDIKKTISANGAPTLTFNIPLDFKNRKMKIKFSTAASDTLILKSAILS